jgi:hypothetical protein
MLSLEKQMKLTPRLIGLFMWKVAQGLLTSAGQPATRKSQQRPVRRINSETDDDGLFEETQTLMGAGHTINDYPHLPDQGEFPEKPF